MNNNNTGFSSLTRNTIPSSTEYVSSNDAICYFGNHSIEQAALKNWNRIPYLKDKPVNKPLTVREASASIPEEFSSSEIVLSERNDKGHYLYEFARLERFVNFIELVNQPLEHITHIAFPHSIVSKNVINVIKLLNLLSEKNTLLPNLVSLSFGGIECDICFPCFPSTVTSLSFGFVFRKCVVDILSYPPNLISASLSINTHTNYSQLPSSLTSLSISVTNLRVDSSFLALCKSLKSIEINTLIDNTMPSVSIDFSHLHALESFSLYSPKGEFQLLNASLCPTLKSLNFKALEAHSTLSMSCFPPNLQTLSFGPVGVRFTKLQLPPPPLFVKSYIFKDGNRNPVMVAFKNKLNANLEIWRKSNALILINLMHLRTDGEISAFESVFSIVPSDVIKEIIKFWIELMKFDASQRAIQ